MLSVLVIRTNGFIRGVGSGEGGHILTTVLEKTLHQTTVAIHGYCLSF